jgi:IclR family acetate operon transcriptional repressor
MKEIAPNSKTRIQSVSRSVEVLRLVAAGPEEGRSVNEIAAAMGRPLASIYHLLNTLVDEGMLSKDAARNYHLGLTVGSLGNAYHRQTRPPEEFLARLRELAETTGESTYFSSWRHGEIVVLASVAGSHAVRVSELQQGYAGAAHARASGKLLLAYLEPDELQRYLRSHPLTAVTSRTLTSEPRLLAQLAEVRTNGYSTDVSEFKEGVACVSAPALHEGVVIGAYTVSAPVDRFRRRRKQLVEAVLLATGCDSPPTKPRRYTRSGPTSRSSRPPRTRTLEKEKDER